MTKRNEVALPVVFDQASASSYNHFRTRHRVTLKDCIADIHREHLAKFVHQQDSLTAQDPTHNPTSKGFFGWSHSIDNIAIGISRTFWQRSQPPLDLTEIPLVQNVVYLERREQKPNTDENNLCKGWNQGSV
jgi:hypothetical protein